jgi:hypothetical protein
MEYMVTPPCQDSLVSRRKRSTASARNQPFDQGLEQTFGDENDTDSEDKNVIIN